MSMQILKELFSKVQHKLFVLEQILFYIERFQTFKILLFCQELLQDAYLGMQQLMSLIQQLDKQFILDHIELQQQSTTKDMHLEQKAQIKHLQKQIQTTLQTNKELSSLPTLILITVQVGMHLDVYQSMFLLLESNLLSQFYQLMIFKQLAGVFIIHQQGQQQQVLLH